MAALFAMALGMSQTLSIEDADRGAAIQISFGDIALLQ
jgi:hypothetical protein